jgi:hypothetical protein
MPPVVGLGWAFNGNDKDDAAIIVGHGVGCAPRVVASAA